MAGEPVKGAERRSGPLTGGGRAKYWCLGEDAVCLFEQNHNGVIRFVFYLVHGGRLTGWPDNKMTRGPQPRGRKYASRTRRQGHGSKTEARSAARQSPRTDMKLTWPVERLLLAIVTSL